MTKTPTRSAPRALKASNIAQAIKAGDDARKTKLAAKRATKKAVKTAETEAQKQARVAVELAAVAARDKEQERAAYVEALRVDWTAEGGEDGTGLTFEQYVSSNIGEPEADDAPARKKREQTYFGPMLALRVAAKTYVKAKNGILCSGDPFALMCGEYKPSVVIRALRDAMTSKSLPFNFNPAWNPGQQSMNLRNKARHHNSEGTLSLAYIRECLERSKIAA